jgi:preprotein translocase subunit SecD
MNRRITNLIIILLLLALSIWADLPNNSGIHIGSISKDIKTVLGMDLRGGMQVILSVPENVTVTQQNLQDAAIILENRSNALGVSEVVFQTAGDRIIVGEFPGATNADEVINPIRQVGQLEFIDTGDTQLQVGQEVLTDYGMTDTTGSSTTPEATETAAPTAESTDPAATETATPAADATRWHTILTGSDLKEVSVVRGQLNEYEVSLTFSSTGAQVFSQWTSANIGKFLTIVLDKKVISSPTIKTAITDGSAVIQGSFTAETANALAVQLRYGSLPIPLDIEQIRIIGPTLGEDSLNKSLVAGIIGFVIVFLFMGIYYRLPGLAADAALIFYALLTYAIFRIIPVTLTLPGIAGFLVSTGSALDANILIFERLKEELRNGRTVKQAIDLAFRRAWSSIRDSNIAALITSAILFWFGSTFGASFVKGFALTLALGVIVSVFTALFVTREFLTLFIEPIQNVDQRPGLFGL